MTPGFAAGARANVGVTNGADTTGAYSPADRRATRVDYRYQFACVAWFEYRQNPYKWLLLSAWPCASLGRQGLRRPTPEKVH